jgi:hypothetical protein
MEDLLDIIKGKKLTGLTFVSDDAIRLSFEGDTLTLYQWPTATIDGREVSDSDPTYQDLLPTLTERIVSSVKLDEAKSLEINFDRARIHLQLADDEECFYFKAAGGDWMVG